MTEETNPKFYLVVDVEATCSEDARVPRHEMEIIEIGAVMVSAESLQPVSEFQCFVHPVRNPILTPFCTELTTITQDDVDAAPFFYDAMERFQEWFQSFPDFLFCSWGNYDRNQFMQDCEHHRVEYPLGSEHLNLKTEFPKRQGLPKKTGLAGALNAANLAVEGVHHRGLDDAKNIARLLPFIVGTKTISHLV